MCSPKMFNGRTDKTCFDKVELGDELKVRKVSQDIQNKLLVPKQLKERKDINLYEKV